MNVRSIKHVAFGIGVLALQLIFFRHLKIFGVKPDVILIFLVWYMTKSTRTAALLMAAFLGFSQDALLDLWGLNMFAKTLTVFAVWPWISANLEHHHPLPRILSVIFITALIHNFIMVILSLFTNIYTAEFFLWQNWLGNAIYTTIIAAIAQLFSSA